MRMEMNNRRHALLLALLLLLIAITSGEARAQDGEDHAGAGVDASLTLRPVQDATVDEGRPTSNFGDGAALTVAEWPDALTGAISAYALLDFDLSAFPPGTIIDAATLTLRQIEAENGGNWPVTVSRLVTPWLESEVTWSNRPRGVTVARMIAPEATGQDVSADVTDAVDAIVNFPANTPYSGFALSGTPALDPPIDIIRGYDSSEGPASPRLDVRYTLPPLRVCLGTLDGCNPAPGATVHNRTAGLVRSADATGLISDTTGFALGDQLWARAPMGGGNGGMLYWTSPQPVTIDASAYVATAAGSELWLVVSPSTPLWIQDLDLSAQWHVQGSLAEERELRRRIISASNHLYSFTDGQFALGRVTVRQRYEGWDDANIQLFASNTLQPKAIVGGIVPTDTVDPGPGITISYTPGAVSMGSYWNRFGSPPGSTNVFEGVTYTEEQLTDDWSLALAHEFGHYLLYLFDTYTGIDGTADLDLARLCTGTAMGDVYVPTNQGFIWNADFWADACGGTEAFDVHNGRVEWQTIRTFYSWVQVPNSFVPGPAGPPAAVTSVVFVPPADAGAAAAQLFNLDYVDGQLSSGEARAFLLRAGRILEQGKPAEGTTQVALTGAEVGDQLCVYDINDYAEGDELPRHQFGCEVIAAGDDTLRMTRRDTWSPQVLLTQTGPQTIGIEVVQDVEGPAAPLVVRLYPEHKTALQEVVLPLKDGVYSATIALTETVPPFFARLYVDEAPDAPETRREVIVDRGTGGGGAFGPARAYGDVLVYSSDGNASFEGASGLELQPGQSIAWQTMPGTPPLPFTKWIIGQSYRLDAFPASLVEEGIIKIRFEEQDGMAAAAAGVAQNGEPAVHFWDGQSWAPLATQITVPAGATDGVLLASAPSAGVGVYAVLADAPAGRVRFLPMVLQE